MKGLYVFENAELRTMHFASAGAFSLQHCNYDCIENGQNDHGQTTKTGERRRPARK